MPNVVRWVLGGVVVLLVLGPPLVLYRFEYVHAKRFREVTPGRFYRSGQMTADGFAKPSTATTSRPSSTSSTRNPTPFSATTGWARGRSGKANCAANWA